MSSHSAFLKRLAELTRNQSVVWSHAMDGSGDYEARVDTYRARLSGGGADSGSALRFLLLRRDEVMVEVNSRRIPDFQTTDDSAYMLKLLFEAVQRQQAGRETAAFEDFLARAEA